MSVRLRPMGEGEFSAWLPRLRGSYAEDMVRNAGLTPERAAAKAAEDTERLFPGERPSAELARTGRNDGRWQPLHVSVTKIAARSAV